MKKKTISLLLLALIAVVPLSQAIAETIVDTGEANDLGDQLILRNYQWLAGEFELTQETTLTDIQTYMRTNSTDGGTFTISIYGDDGELPDAGSGALYSGVANRADGSADPAWEGLSGLDWPLPAGSYWVSFEIQSSDTLGNSILPLPSVNPLINEAYRYNGRWYEYDELDMGVRISGTSLPSWIKSPDIDNDNDVDAADMASLAAEMNTVCAAASSCDNDLNDDNQIDETDLQIFAAYFAALSL